MPPFDMAAVLALIALGTALTTAHLARSNRRWVGVSGLMALWIAAWSLASAVIPTGCFMGAFALIGGVLGWALLLRPVLNADDRATGDVLVVMAWLIVAPMAAIRGGVVADWRALQGELPTVTLAELGASPERGAVRVSGAVCDPRAQVEWTTSSGDSTSRHEAVLLRDESRSPRVWIAGDCPAAPLDILIRDAVVSGGLREAAAARGLTVPEDAIIVRRLDPGGIDLLLLAYRIGVAVLVAIAAFGVFLLERPRELAAPAVPVDRALAVEPTAHGLVSRWPVGTPAAVRAASVAVLALAAIGVAVWFGLDHPVARKAIVAAAVLPVAFVLVPAYLGLFAGFFLLPANHGARGFATWMVLAMPASAIVPLLLLFVEGDVPVQRTVLLAVLAVCGAEATIALLASMLRHHLVHLVELERGRVEVAPVFAGIRGPTWSAPLVAPPEMGVDVVRIGSRDVPALLDSAAREWLQAHASALVAAPDPLAAPEALTALVPVAPRAPGLVDRVWSALVWLAVRPRAETVLRLAVGPLLLHPIAKLDRVAALGGGTELLVGFGVAWLVWTGSWLLAGRRLMADRPSAGRKAAV